MSSSNRLSHIIRTGLREGLLGVGLAVLCVAGLGAALALALLTRVLAPLVVGGAVVAVVAAFVWREVSMRRHARALELALRRGPSPGPRETYHGLALPDDASLDENHAWVRASGAASAAIGADDLALRLLGPLDAVIVPPVGARVRRGDVLFTLRRGGRSLDVRSPIDGRVRELNRSALHRPGVVNASPYEHGWIVDLDASDLTRQRSRLRDPPAASSWFRTEVDRALAVLAPGGPMPAMPDGGLVSPDLHELVDDETWSRLRAELFAGPDPGRR